MVLDRVRAGHAHGDRRARPDVAGAAPSRLEARHSLGTHPANDGSAFDETRTGLDHLSLRVRGRAELEAWVARFDELGVRHSGITDASYGSVVVFRDPDNIQLELFVGA